MIDRATFDVDTTRNGTDIRCVLILEGDFTHQFHRYLQDESGVVSLQIFPDEAKKLAEQIGRYV